ncbi:MAG: MBL fold metallo-hydrolase [Candidatus Bathyarchaeota archaeon]
MSIEGIFPIQLGMVKATLLKCNGRLVLVDTGMGAEDAEKILNFARTDQNMPLEKYGELCIITHNHRDHTGGLKTIKERCNLKVVSHIDEADSIESLTGVKVDLKLKDRDVLPYCGGIQFIHVPGHTAGNISLLIKEKSLLIAGDTIFADKEGNLSHPPDHYCTDPEMAKRELKRLKELHFDSIIVSHGKDTLKGAKNKVDNLLK